jgi:tetratricopeptide (TPR) repeat protein
MAGDIPEELAALESLVEGLGDVVAALPKLEGELEEARSKGDKVRMAELLVGISTARVTNDDLPGAIKALKEATALYGRRRKSEEAGICRLQLGRLRRIAGEDGLAMAEQRKASPALEKAGRFVQAAEAAIELGDMLLVQGEWDRALPEFARALALTEKAKLAPAADSRLMALRGIAASKQALGKVDEALSWYQRIESEASEVGAEHEAYMARFARAGLLALASRTAEAVPLWADCLGRARANDDAFTASQCTGGLATYYAEIGEDELAFKMAFEGRDAALLIGDANTYIGMSTLVSALYIRASNPERAYESLANAGTELARAMGDAAYAQEVMAPYMATLQSRLGDKVFGTMQARYEEARRPS